MRISHGTRMAAWHGNNGYGYATNQMLSSLNRLGYHVSRNDPSADVQIWFDQPHHWQWNLRQYRVGYHPWESTDMRQDWKRAMNNTDEIWTPSPIVAKWYKDAGIKRPIYVYEHGVDHKIWTPRRRVVKDKLVFLHVGGEALRKGADLTMKAFRKAFPNNEPVELVMKMNQQGWKVPNVGRIKVLPDIMPLSELVSLYHNSHVFIYPSYGEGFGLNPLQAMATGMPTLVTGAWAPYCWAIPSAFWIDSKLSDSPWPDLHPGKMWKPDFDDVVDKMRWAYENFSIASHIAYDEAEGIHTHYDWDSLTSEAFSALEKRVKNNL